MLLPALVKVRWGGPAVATRARPLFQMPQEGCAAIEAWVAQGDLAGRRTPEAACLDRGCPRLGAADGDVEGERCHWRKSALSGLRLPC